MVGDTITIDKNPKKVACVSRTTYDLLIAFGLGDKVDGAYTTIYDNPWTEYMYPSSKNEYRYAYEENYETFFARGVDLVFAPEKYIADGLKEHGINALTVCLYGNPTFDNYVHFFSNLVTQIWDDPVVKAKAQAWDTKVDKAISDVTTELAKHNVEKKKIFYVRGDKNKGIGYTDTAASFTEYAFRSLGFDFAGASMSTNKPQAEDIVAYNPDVFVIGGIYQNKLVTTLTTTEPYTTLDAVKNGKNVLLIGVNPRDDLRLGNINEQVHAYINNPIKLMHRAHLKDSLEPTRRNSIIASHKISDDGVKSLLTLDLFVYRTLTSDELKDTIRARTIPAGNIIGNLNRKVLMEYIADDDIDYIILGWGNLGSDIWNSLGAYRDELYEALKNRIDKCYWFGATRSGCPRHPSASNSLSKGLTRVSRQELYNALH